MLTDSIRTMMLRELDSLRAEVESYEDEAQLWTLQPGISNSAGTLALHLCGNLQHFIGATFGGTGYVRDRDAEFASRDVPRAEILQQIAATRAAVDNTLPIPDERLDEPFPENVMGRTVTTRDFLVHLVSHLAYHVGQIDYHRRLVTGADPALARMGIDTFSTQR